MRRKTEIYIFKGKQIIIHESKEGAAASEGRWRENAAKNPLILSEYRKCVYANNVVYTLCQIFLSETDCMQIWEKTKEIVQKIAIFIVSEI